MALDAGYTDTCDSFPSIGPDQLLAGHHLCVYHGLGCDRRRSSNLHWHVRQCRSPVQQDHPEEASDAFPSHAASHVEQAETNVAHWGGAPDQKWVPVVCKLSWG